MCVCTHRRSMSDSFLAAMITRADDAEYLTAEIEPWVKENFWRWYKKAGLDPEDVGGSPESLNLSRFTFDALEFAFDNELKFFTSSGIGRAQVRPAR